MEIPAVRPLLAALSAPLRDVPGIHTAEVRYLTREDVLRRDPGALSALPCFELDVVLTDGRKWHGHQVCPPENAGNVEYAAHVGGVFARTLARDIAD